MIKAKRKARLLSDAEEARIQAGIAADPDNPEWVVSYKILFFVFLYLLPVLSNRVGGGWTNSVLVSDPTRMFSACRASRY